MLFLTSIPAVKLPKIKPTTSDQNICGFILHEEEKGQDTDEIFECVDGQGTCFVLSEFIIWITYF
jgi:hypothetical protein